MSDNILVIKLGAFGDLLAIEGALRDIREHHRDSSLYFLTSPPYKKIVEKCPWVDKVLIDERMPRWRLDYLLKLKSVINKQNFSIVYDLQNSYRTDFYFKYLFPKLDWCGTAKNAKFHIGRHEHDNGLNRLKYQLKLAGIGTQHTAKPDLNWINNNCEYLLKDHGIEKDYIVLLYGSSKGNSDKRWPYFKELSEKLVSMGKSVVCVPGPDELEEATSIKGITVLKDNKPISFFDMAYILKKAGFIIGNDTGPTYLAAFSGVPGTVIIGKHVTNMIPFLENTNFSYIKSDNLNQISVANLIEKIQNI